MASRGIDVGDTKVNLLLDGVLELGRDLLVHRGGAEARRRTLDRWGDRPLRVDVNAWLLRGPRGTELVDAGTGPAWGQHLGHAREAIGRFGLAPDAVDRVLLTHLHGDHALGLLDGDGAYFPRARVTVPAADLAFFTDPAERERLPEARRGAFDVCRRVTAAYRDRLDPVPFGALAPGLDLLPLPGHTPGQGGYLLTGGHTGLLLLADALHLGELQADDPDVGLAFDLDPGAAADTRRAILAHAAAEGWVVGGGHLPGLARVTVEGSGFRLSPLDG